MHLKEKSMAVRPTAERDNARKQQNRACCKIGQNNKTRG